MKRWITVCTCLLAFLCVCTVCAGCRLGIGGYVYSYEGKEFLSGDGNLSESVDSIDLDWMAGSVTLTAHDGETVRISETANRELTDDLRVHYCISEGTLIVKFVASGKWNGLSTLKKDLTVCLPRGVKLKEIKTNTAAANMKISDLTAEKMTVDSASGKVDIDSRGDAANMDIFTASGDIRAALGNVGQTKINSASGKVDLTGGKLTDLSIDTSSGDISVTATSIDKLRADTSSGKITVTSAFCGEGETVSSSGKQTLSFGNTPATLSMEAASGDLSLTLPSDASVTAKVHTASGKFTSDLPMRRDGKKYIAGDGVASLTMETASGNIRILTGN